MQKVRRCIGLSVLVLCIALLSAEIVARLSGIGDFPLYIQDAEIGYMVAPNQSGAFLRKNDWMFNEYSMATGAYLPGKKDNTLLIGDSIVQGGNPLSQRDKLGPQLEMLLGYPVWPVGAGGWALLNELAYLRRYRPVLSTMNRVVFVINSDDFGEPAFWTSDTALPRERPWSVALYAMRRYILSPAYVQAPSSGRDWRIELSNFFEGYSGQVLMFLYPTRAELEDPALRKTRLDKHGDEAIALLKNKRMTVVSIANDPLWTSGLYRDDIHPTAVGNSALARIIAKYINVEERLTKSSVGRPELSADPGIP
jgi:hypothetical protein